MTVQHHTIAAHPHRCAVRTPAHRHVPQLSTKQHRSPRGCTRLATRPTMAVGDDRALLSPLLEAEWSKLAAKLPDGINHIAPAQLQAFEKDATPLVIVDVRTPGERQVSRLPGPVVTKEEFEASGDTYKNHRVVCYCTAGFRSGKYAAELASKGGYDNVYNLKGSVLAWAEAGLPFVDGKDGTTPTNKVHCYGASWAGFLDSKYEPVTFSVIQTVKKTLLG